MSTEQVQLLACPFCGCAMRVESNRDWHRIFGDHTDECVFEADSEQMMAPATDDQLQLMIDSWNSRPIQQAVQEDLERMRFKFNTLVEHCKGQDREIAEQRAQLNQISLYQEDAVWFWQGDGKDFPESLACPVIVPAPALRELISRGYVMRELLSMAVTMSPVMSESGPPQVVGRIHHNDQHPEPVRAALNTAGRELPDDTKLYADAGAGSIAAIVRERDMALNKIDQLANMVVAAENLLVEAYNAGQLGYAISSKVDAHFAARKQKATS